jgi:hypothetical protein
VTTHVAIPFRDNLEMTARLVCSLDGAETIHLFDNGSDDDINLLLEALPLDSFAVVHRAPGWTLTEMWNRGLDYAARWNADNLAVLNNDITVLPGFLDHLATALRSSDDLWAVCPDSCPTTNGVNMTGTIRRVQGVNLGGMAGWAFMVKVEALQQIADPQFEWWYGDNDLVKSIYAQGHTVGLVEGLPCDHQTSTTWNAHPELYAQARIDGERYTQKWG